ncbi:MAG: HAMP domain-containing protein, partial [Spirochaetes bacterium]|nr:HAMP domain-containing protein [Spirochaetota bacterium]
FVILASENRIEEAENFLTVEALAQANAIQKELEDLYSNKLEQSKKIVDSNTNTANLAIIIMISITIAAFITAIVLGLTLTLSITKPLIRATGISQKIADGDLRDELSSDFDKKIIKRSDEIGDLVRSVDTVIINFNNLLSEVQSVSDGILSGANQVSSAAQSLSQGSSELASSIEEMSSSIEEMESTIDQNSDNAAEGEKIATKSSQEAKDGGEAVNQTVESMKKIADTIQIITEIANNTNMLALNAAIEAARAGEHGEGFAVVATEVRKLAERSLKAAEEIKKIATSSVQVATKAGELINQVVPSIIKTSDMVQEIASASREQKSGMKQLRQAANQQEQVTQLVSANSEELASAAEESASQAQSLVDLVKAFKLKDEVKTTNVKKDNPKIKQPNKQNTNNITGVLPSPKQKQTASTQKYIAKNEDDYSDIDDSTDFIQL